MDPLYFIVIGLVVWTVIQILADRQDRKEEEREFDHKRKIAKKELFESQEERSHLLEIEEEEFWSYVENITKNSGSSYKNFIGLWKDKLHHKSPRELIEIDNFLQRFYLENFNQDIHAASTIIFQTDDVRYALILLNAYIISGKTIFNNICVNPELIVGHEVNDIVDITLSEALGGVYISKTEKLIPQIPEGHFGNVDIQGDNWDIKELPSKFPELWMKYA